jgi:ATP-dependent NAD(P)H-hydrate dehydratase
VKPILENLLSRLHVLVVGPGLGREAYMQNFAKLAVNIAKNQVRIRQAPRQKILI